MSLKNSVELVRVGIVKMSGCTTPHAADRANRPEDMRPVLLRLFMVQGWPGAESPCVLM